MSAASTIHAYLCTIGYQSHTHATLTHMPSNENLINHTVHLKSELSKYYLYVAEGEGTNPYSMLIPMKSCGGSMQIGIMSGECLSMYTLQIPPTDGLLANSLKFRGFG